MDSLTATSSGATFTATQATLQSSDTLAGGTGVDTLNITDSGTAAITIPAASVSGIENINVRNVNGGTTAVAEQRTITVPFAAANTDTIVVNYGGLTQTVVLTGVTNAAGAATNAGIVAAAINALAGATIATVATNVVTVTAPTAGTALPTIGFSTATAVADYPTIANTRANVAAVGGTDTLAAGGFVGATNFNSDRSTSGLTITGLAQNQQIGVNGDAGTTNGALTATFNAKVTSATLNVTNGTTAGAVTINGNADNLLTTLNINSNGASNTLGGIAAPAATTTVNIAGTTGLKTGGITNVAASTTINVTNAGVVDLGALAANVSTVTATGGLTATLSAVTQKVTGGSGVNTITTGGVLTTGFVTAGAGTTDKLIVAAAADVATTPAAKYTGFEILQNNAAATIDASLIAGITSVAINNAGASGFTNLSTAQIGAVSAIASTAGSTLAMKDSSGTADVLNLKASSTTAGVDVTNLIMAGVETLNFTNSSTAANTLSFDGAAATTGKGLKNITVAGAKGVTLDLAAQNTPAHDTTIVSIDASGLTAQATGTNTFTLKDTVGSAAMKSGTITGSAGDDVFSLGGTTGTNTFASGVVQAISGGAGNDNLTASLGQLYTAGSGWITFDGGANGSSTGDTLTISGTTPGTISDNVWANITNVENVVLANTGAMTLSAGAGFKAAFANGVTITSGASTSNAVTADFSLATGAVKFTNVGTTGVQTITGGTAADTLTITSAAAGNASKVAISGGAGADTIKWTDASTISAAIGSVTGGTGADKITLALTDNASANSFASIVVGAGDSLIGASDTITGFYVGAANTRLSDTIDFAGSAIKPAAAIAATAVTGETLTSLQFTITTAGKLEFTGTKAATLTAAQVESIWTSQITTLLNNLETVVWADATVGDAQFGNSLVFNKNILGDSEVILVGVQAVAVGAAAVTANIVGIA